MKNILFGLFVTILSSSYSNAQSWVQNDAVWHYDYFITGSGFYKISLGNDTIIEGKSCQKYLTKKYQFFPQPGGIYVAGPVLDLPHRYTRTSGDTVFHYENDKFFTLYNFGASVGDQWTITDTSEFTLCNIISEVKVIETDNFTINGTSRRAIRLETIAGSAKGINGWVVENVGPIDSQFLFPTSKNCTSEMNIEFEEHNFKCFEDSYTNLYNPSGDDCEYLLNNVGLTKNQQQLFKLFPNPVNEILTIEFQKAGENDLTITNQIGEIIYSNKLTQLIEEINLSHFSKGVYYIQIENNKNEIRIEKLVKL